MYDLEISQEIQAKQKYQAVYQSATGAANVAEALLVSDKTRYGIFKPEQVKADRKLSAIVRGVTSLEYESDKLAYDKQPSRFPADVSYKR